MCMCTVNASVEDEQRVNDCGRGRVAGRLWPPLKGTAQRIQNKFVGDNVENKVVFDQSLSQSYKLRNPISEPPHPTWQLQGGLPCQK